MITRREFGKLAAGGSASILGAGVAAHAADFPSRQIRVIVGLAAGGPTDVQVRIVAEVVKAQVGQPVIVENRPGASSSIGTVAIKNAHPDGYTVGNLNSGVITLPLVMENLPFDVFTDLRPICLGVSQPPNLFMVKGDFPANTVQEFIAYAKANPGTVNYGSDGVGSQTHIAGEEFKRLTGIQMQHVPFAGNAPEIVSLLQGGIHLGQLSLPLVVDHIKSGALKTIGNTFEQRSSLIPDVPTVREQGLPTFYSAMWTSIWAPAGVPDDVAKILSDKFIAAYQEPAVKAKLEGMGFVVLAGSPDELMRAARSEYERWREPVKLLGIKINR